MFSVYVGKDCELYSFFPLISEWICPRPDVVDLLQRISLRADVAGRETNPFKRQEQVNAESRPTSPVAVRTGRASGAWNGVTTELKEIQFPSLVRMQQCSK
jgi:hypothetical protein